MSIRSFNTVPKFIYGNNLEHKIALTSDNNISILDINSNDGYLLNRLRYSCYCGLYIYPRVFYNNNKNNNKMYKKLKKLKLKKENIAGIFATIKVPNITKWNILRSQIRKHL